MAKQSIEAAVREDIIRGNFAPASWLRLEELKARFEVGFSPIREALSRLAAEGLVELEPNRGFRVAGLSRTDVVDIAVARRAIETMALRLSIERGGDDWEGAIVAGMHGYRRKSETMFDGDAQFSAWEMAHELLHAALLGACGSPRLMSAQKRLEDQHMRYRRLIVMPRIDSDVHVEEHERLVALTLERNVDAAVAAMEQHLMITVEVLDRTNFWTSRTNA